jgi:hypothetical protein
VTDDYNGEQQEGFGPFEHDGLEGAALVGGQCLSQARAEAAQLRRWCGRCGSAW